MSDIPGNVVALERVLEALDDYGVERWLCLGDIVGYGARPNECCNLIRELAQVTVMGNHDRAVCQPGGEHWFNSDAHACMLWTRDALTLDNREFLNALPANAVIAGIQLCHASLVDISTYIAWPELAVESFAVMESTLCFFGHTHFAEWFVQRQSGRLPEQMAASDGKPIALEEGSRYMINPGAVGQPRDGDSRAAFAVFDDLDESVTIHRVEYDVASAQQQIIAAGLPAGLAARLICGS